MIFHMDVHRGCQDQVKIGQVCLECASEAIWSDFNADMLEHHGYRSQNAISRDWLEANRSSWNSYRTPGL